jgi:hypothetical protein
MLLCAIVGASSFTNSKQCQATLRGSYCTAQYNLSLAPLIFFRILFSIIFLRFIESFQMIMGLKPGNVAMIVLVVHFKLVFRNVIRKDE